MLFCIDLRRVNINLTDKKLLATSFIVENFEYTTCQFFVSTKEERDVWVNDILHYKQLLIDKDAPQGQGYDVF